MFFFRLTFEAIGWEFMLAAECIGILSKFNWNTEDRQMGFVFTHQLNRAIS